MIEPSICRNRSIQSPDVSELVCQTLNAFETAYLIVERTAGRVVWISPGAEFMLPNVTQDGSVVLCKTYPELWRMLQNVYGDEESTSGSPVSVVVDGKAYQCQQAILADNFIGLMVSAGTDTFAQLSKYMADREELFNTSRTITVSEMATTLAHEINQPVGSISNILKGLKARLKRIEPAPEECVLAIDRALEQTNFAARIVSRIRDFTTARQPKRVDCDVQLLLEDSIQLLDWVLMNANVTVELRPAVEKLWVTADDTMLQQVFTNLIRNAVDATREGGNRSRILKINASRQGDEVQIDISDNGHGLTDSTQDSIFVPFVTQKTQGMGVGLNICRSFVELHQGKLWLMPNDDGGCTASVLLPILNRTESAS